MRRSHRRACLSFFLEGAWRVLRTFGSTMMSTSAAAISSMTSDSGRVKNTVGSPRESSNARRRFSSIIGPSTKPSSSGAGSHSSLTKTTPSKPEEHGLQDVEVGVVDAVDADRAEQQDRGIEQAIGHAAAA